jgi:predicted aspartyl protease
LSRASRNERIDINALCGLSTREGNGQPHANIKGKKLSVLLDSGAIGRDFITDECCKKLSLSIKKLLYPITVFSIHGEEIATEGVLLPNISITSYGKR